MRIIKKYLGEEYRVYLFGSWAKGNALETSDIDVGILGNKKVSWSMMTKINEEIRAIPTLRKIDVVDLLASDERFKQSVLKSAKELDERLSAFSF